MTRTQILLFFIALFLVTMGMGCVQTQPRTDQNVSDNITATAIDIALKNESVRSYLTGNWSIQEVNPNAQVSWVHDGKSVTLDTPDVKIETDTAIVHVYVDLPNKSVVSVWGQSKRTPMP